MDVGKQRVPWLYYGFDFDYISTLTSPPLSFSFLSLSCSLSLSPSLCCHGKRFYNQIDSYQFILLTLKLEVTTLLSPGFSFPPLHLNKNNMTNNEGERITIAQGFLLCLEMNNKAQNKKL